MNVAPHEFPHEGSTESEWLASVRSHETGAQFLEHENGSSPVANGTAHTRTRASTDGKGAASTHARQVFGRRESTGARNGWLRSQSPEGTNQQARATALSPLVGSPRSSSSSSIGGGGSGGGSGGGRDRGRQLFTTRFMVPDRNHAMSTSPTRGQGQADRVRATRDQPRHRPTVLSASPPAENRQRKQYTSSSLPPQQRRGMGSAGQSYAGLASLASPTPPASDGGYVYSHDQRSPVSGLLYNQAEHASMAEEHTASMQEEAADLEQWRRVKERVGE